MANRKRKHRTTRVLSRYRFRQKVHSKTAKAALIASSVMLFVYLLLVAMAFFAEGHLSAYYGSAGTLAMAGSLVCLILAIKSRFEDNVFMLYPNLALLVSMAACIFWIGTYGIGFSL